MMKKITIIKRDGRKVDFDVKKIYNAIEHAYEDETAEPEDVLALTNSVTKVVKKLKQQEISVEKIQDIVEDVLLKNKKQELAKKYIRYRANRNQVREASTNLMKLYKDIYYTDAKDMDLKRDNANINGDSSMGIMLKCGAEGNKYFIDNFVLDKRYRDAAKENFIHIHDKDFSLITFNCCQIDFMKLLHGGFSTGHGYLREPNSIRSYAALACIAIQSNQNDMFGGQSINCWDFAMAEGVRKSFVKLFRKYAKFAYSTLHVGKTAEIKKFNAAIDEDKELFKSARYLMPETIEAVKNEFVKKHTEYKDVANKVFLIAYDNACVEVEEQTKQAMEAAIANLNSMHSRAGAQTPFSSINYGTDISPEGRLATKKTLDAVYEGLGNGETAIFPISVFQIKKGFNYEPSDPNYDLFKYAMKVSAKRLFPNFVNEDAPYNAQYYKPGDYNSLVATMGCRTRVMGNVNGPEVSGSRGNFAFTTLNLPKFALEAKGDINKFFEILDKYIYLSKDYLEDRYTIIKNKHVFNFPFLMEQGVWLDSEKLNKNDTIEDVLKHSSISIGFCGLAECLVALIGKHHGESKEAQKLGLKIVGHIREMTDKFTDETHMNWSTFGTPKQNWALTM